MKITRIGFIKSLIATPLFSFNKEESVKEYLISENYILNRFHVPAYTCSASYEDLVSKYVKYPYCIQVATNNQVCITKYFDKNLKEYVGMGVFKIENISELKQLFKFLEIK